jgi:hypothetical protein
MSYFKRSAHKYNATKVETDGHSFSSKLEAALYQHLRLREKAGEIKILQTQDHVYLTDARIAYIPDFKCEDLSTGEIYWVEAKGFESDRWPTIKKLWKHYGPGRLEIWKGTYLRLHLEEVLKPKVKAEQL